MSKAGKTFLAICIGLISLTALTPLILSTKFGNSLLVSAINQKIPGSIAIEKMSLSWFGNQKMSQFKLKSSLGDPVLSIKTIKIEGFLPFLLLNPKNLKEIEITDATIKIEQDAKGTSNIENALGIKKLGTLVKTPVFVNHAHLLIKKDANGIFNALAQGETLQNNLNGNFSLDVSLKNKGYQKIDLHAKHFPTLVLDQTLALSNPRLSGVLLALFGESIDLSGNQEASSVFFNIKSSYIQANLQGELIEDQLMIKEGGTGTFSIPSKNLEKLKILPFKFLEPLKGEIVLQAGSIPLKKNLIQQLTGRINLTLQPNRIEFQDKIYQLNDFVCHLLAENKIDLKIQLNALENGNPLTLKTEAQFPKALNSLAVEGIHFSTELKGSKLSSTWEGTFKERDTEINATLLSHAISFKKMKIKIPYLPFREIIEDKESSPIEGKIIIYRPEWNSSFLALDEVALPWIIDMHDNTLKLNLIGTVNSKEVIKGSLRADQLSKLHKSALQLNLKLEEFHIEAFHALFPSHPIKRILGDTIDAGLTASRDCNGFIEGAMEFSAAKNSDVFLKKISSNFTMQNNNQDLTFHTETQQAIGTTRFLGTFHNIWDERGNLNLNWWSSVSVQGNLKHFPISVMTKIITGDEKIADSMEAVLGCQVDAELYAEVKNQEGPVRASIKGLNGQCHLNGKIVDNELLLEEPLLASLK